VNKILAMALMASLTGTGRQDIKPVPMDEPEINRTRWWKAFCHEIEAIGGIVVGGPDSPLVNENGELNVKVPKHRVREAAAIVQKYAAQNPDDFRE
jgi:hypothetical protein